MYVKKPSKNALDTIFGVGFEYFCIMNIFKRAIIAK